MRDENVRVREKFELSLDGRQIASIVVGALVILGVVFVLGLNVGRQIAARQVEAARGGDLAALDRVPVAAADPAKNDLTFYDQLPKGKPAPPPPEPARPAPAPAQQAAVHPAAAPPAPVPASPAPSAPPEAAQPPVAPAPAAPALAAVSAAPPTAPAPAPAPAKPSAAAKPAAAKAARPAATGEGFAIQLAATSSRAEAERLAARHRALSPRIEAADVPGKGRVYRVRAGSYGSRAEAERALAAAARQSGAKGFVTATR
ncbi:MAG TPA: SPOR domain-containing protein [Anaeromyxobacteraceae bacterium]|nr:SPOR domain-containing protein [Anaeromyxobacteraceae bacterium]